MGILTDIFKGVTKPGRDLLEIQRLIGTVRKMDPNINKNLNSLEKRIEAQKAIQEYQPMFQSQEEQVGMFLRPGETALRNAATVGSMIAPVGIAGSIASRAGAGAVGGALGSYGMTPITEDASLGRILGGAGLGALVGGTIGAVEKGIAGKAARGGKSGLTKLGEKIEKGSTGIKTPKTPLGEDMAMQSFDDVSRITSKYKANPDVSGIGKAYKGLSNDLTKSLRASKAMANADDIALEAAQKLADNLGVTDDKALRLIDSTLNRVGKSGVLDAQGLASLKKMTQPVALRVQKLIDTGGNLTPSAYAEYALNRVADDILKAGLDDAGRAIYQDMAILHSVAPDIITKADKAGHITVANIKVPTAGIPQKLQATAGKGLQAIGGLQLPQVSEKVMSKLGTAGIFGTRLGQAIGYEGQPMEQQMQQPQQLPQGIEPQGASALNLMLAQEVLNGNISATEANAVLSLLGMSGGATKKTALQQKAESALTTIDTLDAILQEGGNNVLLGQLLPFQGGSTQAQIYNSAATDIMDTLARLRTGAVINEQEEKMYRGYIPKITDTPERRQYKLQLLRQVFGSLANSATPTTGSTDMDLLQTLGLQ